MHLHECTNDSFLAFTVHGLHHEDWAFPGCEKNSRSGGALVAINVKLDQMQTGEDAGLTT